MVHINLNVRAIEKLIDYLATGIGAIPGPMLAPWRAYWEGRAKRISARADADVRRIQAASEAETSAIIAKARADAREFLLAPDAEVHGTAEFTREDIIQRIEFQERKRLTNIRSVVEGAADDLGDKEVADHDPDPDWAARFFDYVQDVSYEDMQRIWARILAGEVESPGQTSLRTLDTLRNMTKRDAEMFGDICPLIIGDGFVFYDDSVKDLSVLSLRNLLHLQDCGLLSYERGIVSIHQWGNENYILLDHLGDVLLVTNNKTPSEPLMIPAVRLTSSGRELSKLIPQAVNMEYLRAFSKFLQSKGCSLEYLVGVEPLPDEMIRYTSRIPIEPQSEQSDGATP